MDTRAGADRVPRQRLLGVLKQQPLASAVVISAAAGSGKSTLASQWSEIDDRPHALVALAPHLDDPAVLGSLIVDALEEFGPSAPSTRAVLTGTEPEFSAVLLPAIRELAASRTRPFVLVLDDAHLLRESRCHQLLAALCDGIPDGSTLTLVTRDAAPAWLGRARVEGRLTEVRDLAMDRDEAALLFVAAGVHLEETELADVLSRSEGWAVGLYLVALARTDGRGSPTGDFRRFLDDYLQTQVLDALTLDQQDFLTSTSGLDELSGPLCDAVTGRADSETMLRELARRVQLVITVDGHPPRYRYHHLLADCLQAILCVRDPGSIPELHARAAQWFAARGDLDSAIRHAKRSGDLRLTGELVWSEIVPCIGSGRPDRLGLWLGDLDDRQLQEDRWLSLAASWLALQQGNGGRMRRWALAAEAHAGRDWRRRVATDDYAASLATLLVLIGQSLNDVVTLAGDALEGLPPTRASGQPLPGFAASR